MRRKVEQQTENQDRWLLTYADMITLLMAFFVMMYSMSVLSLSRFSAAANSIRKSLGGQLELFAESQGGSPATLGDIELLQSVDETLRPLIQYINSLPQSGVDGIEVSQDYRGLVISIKSDKMLFRAASPSINPTTYPILDRIAQTLSKIDNRIQIEGHTCDLPPISSRYETNWELSADRATKVVRYFVQQKGLNPAQFAPVGHADNYPVVPNTSETNRQKNRRVEIVILRKPADLAQNLLSEESGGDETEQP